MSGDPPPAGGGRSTEELLGDLADATRVARSVVARGRAAYDADEALRYAAQMVLVRLREVASRLDPADAAAAAPGFDWRGLARPRGPGGRVGAGARLAPRRPLGRRAGPTALLAGVPGRPRGLDQPGGHR